MENKNITYMIVDDALNASSFILVFMYGSGLITNFMVLRVFICNRRLLKPVNFFTITLCCVNLLNTFFHVPFLIAGISIQRIPFGSVGCQVQAYLFVFFAIFTLFLLMVISLERYFIVERPFEFHRITFKLCFKIFLVVTLTSAIWPILPLIGWSRYDIEANGIFCTSEFNDRSLNAITFAFVNITLFWLSPLVVIIYTNIKLFLILKSKAKNIPGLSESIGSKNHKLIKRKRNQFIIIIFLSGGYICSWTPYVLIMLYGSFYELDNLPLSVTVVPMIASKATIVWCPFLEMLFNSSVRKNLIFIQNFKKDDVIIEQEMECFYPNDTKERRNLIDTNNFESLLSLTEFRHADSKHPDMRELSFKHIKEFEIF